MLFCIFAFVRVFMCVKNHAICLLFFCACLQSHAKSVFSNAHDFQVGQKSCKIAISHLRMTMHNILAACAYALIHAYLCATCSLDLHKACSAPTTHNQYHHIHPAIHARNHCDDSLYPAMHARNRAAIPSTPPCILGKASLSLVVRHSPYIKTKIKTGNPNTLGFPALFLF